MENIEALLFRYGATLNALKYINVYLRDPSDYHLVKEVLKELLPDSLPRIFMRGTVCRPSWLVEIEGVAITDLKNDRYSPFC